MTATCPSAWRRPVDLRQRPRAGSAIAPVADSMLAGFSTEPLGLW
ncbi:hypothetical protein FF36_01826 [Frankia torreyi]|uniref:Uncharacterized protein n=1 Tax=Frankia torreyi TaxID=1856 RepID=A0A0D8BKH0_9ACTN|nr:MULTISPECIES: hypothetical protein [Frankia]KJE23892.1 hypothetical protein FF36_01826 [Frankia torreyi]KQM05801.1 hypothetical protein FF86_101387 [Frankia sp. CpI1-P]